MSIGTVGSIRSAHRPGPRTRSKSRTISPPAAVHLARDQHARTRGIHARSPITRMTGALAQVYRPSSPHGILRPDTSTISIFSVTWYAPAAANWSRRARRRDQSPMRLRRSNVIRRRVWSRLSLARRNLCPWRSSLSLRRSFFFSFFFFFLSHDRQPDVKMRRIGTSVIDPARRVVELMCNRMLNHQRYTREIRHVVIDSKVLVRGCSYADRTFAERSLINVHFY